jgi:hypothetical protein
LFALILLFSTSLCSAKTFESNDDKYTAFGSINIIDSQGIKFEVVFIKEYYPKVTGYTFRFDQGRGIIIAENEDEINDVKNGTMLINGITTYELPKATLSKTEMYGDYKGKYTFSASIKVLDDNENNVKARRIVSLINSAEKIDITFTFKNGERITYEIPPNVLYEWKQVVAYPNVI